MDVLVFVLQSVVYAFHRSLEDAKQDAMRIKKAKEDEEKQLELAKKAARARNEIDERIK